MLLLAQHLYTVTDFELLPDRVWVISDLDRYSVVLSFAEHRNSFFMSPHHLSRLSAFFYHKGQHLACFLLSNVRHACASSTKLKFLVGLHVVARCDNLFDL